MKILTQGDRLSITYRDTTITDIKVFIEYFSKHNAYIPIYNEQWDVNCEENQATAKSENGGTFCLKFGESKYGLEVKAEYVAGDNETVEQVLRMRVQGRLPVRPKNTIYNDYDYWFNGNRCDFHMNCYSETVSLTKNQHVYSQEQVSFMDGNGGYGVLGALTFENYYSTVRLWENGHFELTVNMNEHWHTFDSFRILPNQVITSDKFLIYMGKTCGLDVLGEAIASEYGVTELKEIPTGYNSGYYFGSSITEEIMSKEINVLKKENINVKYFVLDWGWFDKYGDWNANEKFPKGMKYIADKIKEAGMVPGIWIRPFYFEQGCKPLEEHPDWFITDANYAGGKNNYIDFSVQGACDWLSEFCKKLTYDWGYRYIKFDFVVFDLALGGYRDKSFTALKNYRKALEIMRNSVTEDTLLMSCTAPMSPSVKFADATRTGHDIYDNWTSLLLTAKQTLKRLYMSKYLIIDPDVFQARTKANEDEDCVVPNVRTEEEINTYVTFQSVTGGAIIFSDKEQLLDQKALDRMRALLPINKKPAVALDLYESDIPSIFRYDVDGEFEMYAIINWFEYDEEFEINLSEEKFAKEYFSRVEFDKAKVHKFKLKPHQSMILYFNKCKENFAKLTKSIMY